MMVDMDTTRSKTKKPQRLPETKTTTDGRVLYLTWDRKGAPIYVSIPSR